MMLTQYISRDDVEPVRNGVHRHSRTPYAGIRRNSGSGKARTTAMIKRQIGRT